ncbi:MAG TPA: aldo/keto reductase [bacterium]|nr:aldo/keto reductase [bacterium]
MQYREAGRTGIRLSVIGLGGHEYLPGGGLRGFEEDWEKATTPGYVFPGFGGEPRKRVLRAAYDAGINFFDVTQDSEKEALGRNLREMPPPHEVFVQTRPELMMYDRDPGNRRMADYGELKTEVQRILKLMGRDHLDFLNLGITPEAWRGHPDYLPRLKDTTERLKAEGLIRFTSADTFRGEATYLAQIGSGAFDTLFINLNFADTAGRAQVLPAAHAAGMGVVAREAYLKGALFPMGEEAGLADRTALARAALRWVLGVPELTCIVLGAATPEHLQANLAVLDAPTPDDADRALLERLRATPRFDAYAAQKQREFADEPA